MTRVLVTGANGFVGRRVCALLWAKGYAVRSAIRRRGVCLDGAMREKSPLQGDIIEAGNIDVNTNWSKALNGIDIVVHLAARVHVMQETSKTPLESFRSVNVHGTERLARMAIEKGVKRFVYISSISIHGNSTDNSAYVEGDDALPHSPYAISKWEGELVLRKIEKESDLEVVIIRPPLVYGAGVGGNFLRLMQWAHRGFPLPLKGIRNKRSFIGVENLSDLIECCVSNPNATGETFVVSDGEDLSTSDLVTRVAKLMGRPARMMSVPVGVLRMLGRLAGKEDVIDRLCNSLCVDASKARLMLGWQPRVSFDVGLESTVRWYMSSYKNRGICAS